jgi:hypothetical protein
MLLGMGYPTGKKTRAGTGMGKNLNPHAGMGFLAGKVRVSGCEYGMALPNGFLPVAISTRVPRGHPSPVRRPLGGRAP